MTTYKQNRKCKDCGNLGVSERHRCRGCALIYNRERVKKYGHYYYDLTCEICKKPMKGCRKTQKYHKECINNTNAYYYTKSGEEYKNSKGNAVARQIAKSLGLSIDNGHCVHHVDENKDNNELVNLLYMSKKAHNSLHKTLRQHWSLGLKNSSKYSEDCWNILRAHLTTAWLETTSAKVIKLSEIGQSAGEPLNVDNTQEEASETMHGKPKGG